MDKYIIDASSLIDAVRFYPPDNFKPFWKFLLQINHADKLIIIDKVKDEIDEGYDFLSTDFSPKVQISDADIPEVINLFSEITSSLSNSQHLGFYSWLSDDADPYVIAYGEYLKRVGNDVVVLHGEKEHGNKIRIPYVCNKIGLAHDEIHRIIKEEELSFSLV